MWTSLWLTVASWCSRSLVCARTRIRTFRTISYTEHVTTRPSSSRPVAEYSMRPRATTFPTSSFSPHSSSRSSEERFCELIRATPSNDAIPWPPRSGITSRHHFHRTREKCANDALGQRDDKLCAIPNQVRRNREIGWHTRLASHHARALLRIL